MSNALATLTKQLATRLDINDGAGLMETLKATAFRGQVNDSQMTALMIVANQYGLNPWTKEIYAFPDTNNGIVPVVGVDGWARIINEHPQFDGMEFSMPDDGAECTCTIYRKDRAHPISVTEYFAECRRDVKPWKSHPKRMLRHKAMIQCARLSFGYVGIYDQDEAERIAESGSGREIDITPKTEAKPELPECPDDDFQANCAKWRKTVEDGKQTAETLLAKLVTRAAFTESQRATILSWKAKPAPAPAQQSADDFDAQLDAAGGYVPE